MQKRAFPTGFLWGAAVAAHQVEGGNHNQWTEWEQLSAVKLGKATGRRHAGLPSWAYIKQAVQDPTNYISGAGVEHFQRYKEDLKLLKQLNMNAFRFSIEWSRIEPEEGVWNQEAIDHYRHYLAELKRLGIEPIVTLWHWTVPVWFAQKGEFERRRNVHYFERFVGKIAEELGDLFQYVTLLNEPTVHVSESYVRGNRPPVRKNVFLAARVCRNLVVAHRCCYKILKRTCPDSRVGIAFALSDIRPSRCGFTLNSLAAMLMRYVANWWFLDRIRNQLDFIGANYYFTSYIDLRGRLRNPPKPLSDLGWYMEPSGIYQILLTTWRRYRKPLIVTENGLADNADAYRTWWIQETLEALKRALGAGVNLRGYLHWSLLDNFEWEHGYWPKFGLVAVDRSTMERTVRPSAQWFADYIREQAGD